jgi:hypothetical protein
MRDKACIERTLAVYAAVIGQVRSALARRARHSGEGREGRGRRSPRRRVRPAVPPDEGFHHEVRALTKKAIWEALDGSELR